MQGLADRRGAEEKMACYLDLACYLGFGLLRRLDGKSSDGMRMGQLSILVRLLILIENIAVPRKGWVAGEKGC